MEDAWDYSVEVSIVVDIFELYCGELNAIGADRYIEDNLVEWVLDVFGSYMEENSPISFLYMGKKIKVTFTFEICDDSEADAESFVDYCINHYELPEGIKYCSHSKKATELWPDSH